MGVADKRVRLLRKLITSIVASRAKRKVAAKSRVTKRKRATPR